MATIEKRLGRREDGTQQTSYRVKVRLATGSATATFNRLTDAKRWAAQTETEIRQGRYFEKQEAHAHTVADAIDAYLRGPAFARLKDQRNTKARLAWWRAEYGKLTLARFGADVIAEARDRLTADGRGERHDKARTDEDGKLRGRKYVGGLAAATVNLYLADVSRALNRAVREQGWLSTNPAAKVDRLTENNAREWALSADEQKALLAACDASKAKDLRLLVLLALTTAGRRSELLGLRWPDVDLAKGRATFRDTKNGSTRTVAVVGPALDLLKQKNRVRCIGSDLVFPSSRNQKEPATFRQAWDKAVIRAGLLKKEGTPFAFHELRHTALTNLACSGATLRELAAVAGHRSLAMVARYTHLTEDHTSKVVERMVAKTLGGAA
jgi:integrase